MNLFIGIIQSYKIYSNVNRTVACWSSLVAFLSFLSIANTQDAVEYPLLHDYCYLIIGINNDIHTTMDKGITMSSIRTDVTQLNLMERVQNSLTY
jgi:hypothetical protein